MGLFSFLNKNKQETTESDGGYVSRDDAEVSARARSKRASSAGEPAARRGKDAKASLDPVLPEKKRARRRLVGAIALALAVAVGLPMVLDSGPRPLATDIDIRIPSRERAPALPMPGPVAASDALEPSEQIVDPAQADVRRDVTEVRLDGAAKAPATPLASGPVPLVTKPALPKPPAPDKPEAPKPAASKAPAVKPEPAVLAREQEAARALAILQGRSVPKAPATAEQFVVQVAALATQAKVAELQVRLKQAGIASFTEKVARQGVIRVRVGPLSKDDAEAMRARLVKLGLSGSVIPT